MAEPQLSERPRISAVITTFNEEHNVAACVESLLWCDEVVVVDSFSTDTTPAVAKSYEKVRFLQRKYFGSASQKNWAMDQAQFEWILILDADERCTPELQAEIEATIRDPRGTEAFIITRRVYFMDRVIRFSGWQHDRVVRLVKRGAGRYPNKRVHTDMKTRGPARVLRQPMLHFMIESFDQYLPRIVKYGFWGAAQGWKTGRKSGFWQVFGRTLWRFLRMYVFQFGFLDGMPGLVFCMLQAFGTYLKWAILWEWRQNATRGHPPALPAFDEDGEVWTWEGDAGEAVPPAVT
ncbi:MAG TPA: glycosyltransferase family 2 protein [Thermoanaerobaculaceae bacterium]|nr:glycosyltransferase family 2 protein [Thermoanaerobaculaceae bacterium]HPS78000.1 glycosyltransferase family 2 protein [Thermoanaerobaculaceae bacterium]